MRARTTRRRSDPRTFVVLLAVVAGLATAPAAVAGPVLDRAVSALRDEPVYVAPAAERRLTEAEADELRARIAAADSTIYVVVLPARARSEADGTPEGVVRVLMQRLPGQETVAALVGDSFRGGSTALEPREGAALAEEAFSRHSSEGVGPTLEGFVELVDASGSGLPTGPDGEGFEEPLDGGPVDDPLADDDGISSLVGFLLPVLVFGGIGFAIFRAFAGRSRRRVSAGAYPERADFDEVKAAAKEDLLALAEDVSELDDDVEQPAAPPQAKEEYMRALDLYERGSRSFDAARTPEDLAKVAEALEEGRYRMEAAKAHLAGREPPERRPPCFFDPRHGASTREVEWSPPWGAPRSVPVCEADALRIEAGDEPEPREVLVGGERTPWWNAPAYGPYGGGFYGGFGGLFPGLLFGSLLGSAFSSSDAHAGVDDGGSWGGDFGGGDFGGGDFGGGDIGGGEF